MPRDHELTELLRRTSRTFALAIPMLPEPRHEEVMVAYLLFRIADTLEDAAPWSRDQRIEALHDFVELMESGSARDAAVLGRRWREAGPSDHEGYLDLLDATDRVVAALDRLDPEARSVVRHHTIRTCRGMAAFVSMADRKGRLRLHGLEALRTYCYAVAGIVGEMLTELFLMEGPEVRSVEAEVRRRALFFGEALQLVNVVRDVREDGREGRWLLDERIDRETVLHLAFRDLKAAAEYTRFLQEADAPTGILSFTALPVRLAIATLEAVRNDGPGAKIGRGRVTAIVGRTMVDLANGSPPVPATGWPGADVPWDEDWRPVLPPPPWEAGAGPPTPEGFAAKRSVAESPIGEA